MLLDSKVIVIATRNQGKVKEFAHYFNMIGKEVRSLHDYPDLPEVIEDGITFSDNAWKKAKTIADHLQVPVIADDSGLCVDALQGAPGVHSARYAGEHGNSHKNNEKLLQELHKLNDENELQSMQFGEWQALSPAQFVCSLVLYNPNTKHGISSEGTCEGYIIAQPQGEQGFGYDPLFYVPHQQRTMAQLTKDEKNQISHRGKAIRQLMEKLKK